MNLTDAITKGEKLPVKTFSPEQRGELINWLQHEFEVTKRQIAGGYLHLGKLWRFCIVNKMFMVWGSHVKNANDLIRELNLGVSRSLLDHYGRIYETFGEFLMREDIYPPVSRLIQAHPLIEMIKDETEKEAAIEKWVMDANTLPHHDFLDQLAVAKGQIPSSDCDHNFEPWQKCTKCNRFFKL